MTELIQNSYQEILNEVTMMLKERGIQIPEKHVDMTIVCMTQWLENSLRGKEFMAYLLELDSVSGDDNKIYGAKDCYGRLTQEIKPENIVFLRGCIINKHSFPVQQIVIYDRPKKKCTDCEVSVSCHQKIDGEIYCSNCLESSGDMNLKSEVELSCDNCNDYACTWNIKKERRDNVD